MPKKANHIFQVDVDDQAVVCRSEKNFKVTVHVNSHQDKYLLAIRNGETAEEAVRRAIRERREKSEFDVPPPVPNTSPDLSFLDTSLNEELGLKRQRHRVAMFDPGTFFTEGEQRKFQRGTGKRRECNASSAAPNQPNDEMGPACSRLECIQAREAMHHLTRKRKADQGMISTLCDQLEFRCHGLDDGSAYMLRHLQLALIQLLDEEGVGTLDEGTPNDNLIAHAATEEMECVDGGHELDADLGEGCSNGDGHFLKIPVQVCIPSAHDDVMGVLALTEKELLWMEHGATVPSIKLELSNVSSVATQKV